jgi:hypothetical protein
LLVLLILASVVDLLLAGLLIGVSGFIFEGHEGLGGDPSAVLAWSTGLLACIVMPIAGFALRAYRKAGLGVLIAFGPLVGAFVVTFWPFHPY